jgi:hypothetical protein
MISSSLGGGSQYNDENLLSLPAALAMYNVTGQFGSENNGEEGNFLPITTQNYMEKYKEMERILADEKKTNNQFKKFYQVLKTDHTRCDCDA